MSDVQLITVSGVSITATWESSIVQIWNYGNVDVDYMEEKPGRSSTLLTLVEKPSEDPRIHKHYKEKVPELVEKLRRAINTNSNKALNSSINQLVEDPRRRMVYVDQIIPEGEKGICRLLSMWLKLSGSEHTILNMNTHFSVQHGFQNAFSDMYLLTYLQKLVAEKLSILLDKPITVGRYVSLTDLFCISGSAYSELDAFLYQVRTTAFNDRTLPEVFFSEITNIQLEL